MIAELRDKALEAIRRDITNIFKEASKAKLTKENVVDLISYVKLLTDLLIPEEPPVDLTKLPEKDLRQLASQLSNAEIQNK